MKREFEPDMSKFATRSKEKKALFLFKSREKKYFLFVRRRYGKNDLKHNEVIFFSPPDFINTGTSLFFLKNDKKIFLLLTSQKPAKIK